MLLICSHFQSNLTREPDYEHATGKNWRLKETKLPENGTAAPK